MSFPDGVMETVLAFAGIGLVLNVAFAVLVWIYVLLFVSRSVVSVVLGAVFIVFGSLSVIAYIQSYYRV